MIKDIVKNVNPPEDILDKNNPSKYSSILQALKESNFGSWTMVDLEEDTKDKLEASIHSIGVSIRSSKKTHFSEKVKLRLISKRISDVHAQIWILKEYVAKTDMQQKLIKIDVKKGLQNVFKCAIMVLQNKQKIV